MFIGPNGSGKSNLIDAIGLLQVASTDAAKRVRESGGVGDWIWRGEPKAPSARVEIVTPNPTAPRLLRYRFEFAEQGQAFLIVHERLADEEPMADKEPWVWFDADSRHATIQRPVTDAGDTEPVFNTRAGDTESAAFNLWGQQSVFALLKDPNNHPEITRLGEEFSRIRLYRDLHVGREAPVRFPQKPDFPNDVLAEDGRNLALVLNRLNRSLDVKRRFLEALRKLYAGLSDFHVNIEYGTVQIQEGNVSIPATRLSDGTLRYLCLLAVLCDPHPSCASRSRNWACTRTSCRSSWGCCAMPPSVVNCS